jgi:flavorubredoxin
MDEHITLIDTCMESHATEMLERIASIVDLSQIEYIVSNHSEKDHAGSIGRVLEVAPNATVYTSNPNGLAILKNYFGDAHEYVGVKTSDTLNIGKRELSFVQIPMVHWPDSMVTYSAFDKTLFSNDAFGQFLALSERFDTQADMAEVMHAAKKYYANIVYPYNMQTSRAVAAVEKLNCDMIAPAHGVIWTEYIPDILAAYKIWSSGQDDGSAIVAYSSIYGSTARMATALTEAFMTAGIRVRMCDLETTDISEVMSEVMSAKYVCLGSATHNMTVLPYMGLFLTYMKGLLPKAPKGKGNGKVGLAFGSYGWAQAAQIQINDTLEACGFETPLAPVSQDWNENRVDEEALYNKWLEVIREHQ